MWPPVMYLVNLCIVISFFISICKETIFKKQKNNQKNKESILKSNVDKIKPKYVLKIPPKKLIKS